MGTKAPIAGMALAFLLVVVPAGADTGAASFSEPLLDQLRVLRTLHGDLPGHLEGLDRRGARELAERVDALISSLRDAPGSGVEQADYLLSEYLELVREYRSELRELRDSHEQEVNEFLDRLDREPPGRAEERERRRRILLFEGGEDTRRAQELLDCLERHSERLRSLVVSAVRYSLLERDSDRLRVLLDQLDETLPTLVRDATANTRVLDTVIGQYRWFLDRASREVTQVRQDRSTLRARWEQIVQRHGSFLARLPNSRARNRATFELLLNDLNDRASALSGEKYEYLNRNS